MSDAASALAPTITAGDVPPPRFTVKVPSIDPKVPERCVRCLGEGPSERRPLSFRRADGTVERVSVVHWPYCAPCRKTLAPLDRRQRLMTFFGLAQMIVVLYIVGAALGHYDLWWSSMGVLGVLFAAFIHYARQAKQLWSYEWARIDDVYKGGIGACYSFRNRTYAEAFAAQNSAPAAVVEETPNA